MFFLDNLPDDTELSNLQLQLSLNGQIASIQFVVTLFQGTEYFLNCVSVKLGNVNQAESFLSKISSFVYKGRKIVTCLPESLSTRFYILGIDQKTCENDLFEDYRPFRVEKVEIYRQKFGNYAKLLFKRTRDRDMALLSPNIRHGTVISMFPYENKQKHVSKFQLNKSKSHVFSFNGISYNIPSVFVENIDAFNQKCAFKPSGDPLTITKYLVGSTELTHNDIPLLYSVLSYFPKQYQLYFGISAFLNYDNIIYFSNIIKDSSNCDEIVSFIKNNAQICLGEGRMRLLPPHIALSLFQSFGSTFVNNDIVFNYIETYLGTGDLTPMLSLLDFDNLSLEHVLKLVKNGKLSIDAFETKFIGVFSKGIQLSQYSLFEYNESFPLNGAFKFIMKKESNGNRGLIVEASSNLIGEAISVVQGNQSSLFVTRDAPNQCIKIRMGFDSVSLTGYIIHAHNDPRRGQLKYWELSGSNDGLNWIRIHSVTDSATHIEKGSVYYYSVPKTAFFNHIKLTQTGPNSLNYNYLAIAHIEIFGSVKENE